LDSSVQQLFIIYELLRQEAGQESERIKLDQDNLLLENFEVEQMRENYRLEQVESAQYDELLQRLLTLQREYEKLTCREVYDSFRKMFDDFRQSFTKIELHHLFSKLYQEKFKSEFEDWQPQQNTNKKFEEFRLAVKLVEEILVEKQRQEYSKYENKIRHY
jgi:hypothetical protein